MNFEPDLDASPLVDDSTGAVHDGSNGVAGWLRWLVRRPSIFGGFVGGLLLFWLSLFPSLLPRTWFAQAAVSGIAATIGYGIGSGVSALFHKLKTSEFSPSTTRIAWRALVVVGLVVTAVMVWQGKAWQNELRRLMTVEEEPDLAVLPLLALKVLVASMVLFGARLVRSLTRFVIRQIDRMLPRRISIGVGIVLTLLIVVGFLQGFLWRGSISLMNSIASATNGTTSETATQPTSILRSGGPGSLVEWDSLGRQGRDFTGRGPTVADLEAFHGVDCCVEPIRVYVGLDSADTARERADLAVRELERTGAFDRPVLGLFGATGTGWINPRVSESFEYLHRGNTSEVSIQYSFLPSWLSFLVDQSVAAEAGKDLTDAIFDHLAKMPPDRRPKVYLYGESLGSYATESSYDNIGDMQSKADGAMLVGPTFTNPIWTDLTDGRVAGSPQWKPSVRQPGVRFARTPADLEGFAESSSGARIVYLQNSSDPITWFNPSLVGRSPQWADDPTAPDLSPAFSWFPVVTFWQVVADMGDSLGVPTGYGHHFGSNVVDGWVAISAPPGWTPDQTARLKIVVGEGG